MKRRAFLKLGLSALGIVGVGSGAAVWRFLPRAPQGDLSDPRAIASRFFNSLDMKQKQSVAFAYDHPLRQYHNRGVWTSGQLVGGLDFSRSQLGLINDLFHSGLSQKGRGVVTEQFFVDLPGVAILDIKVLGDPNAGPYQVIISGPHLNLRIGGRNREGVAFGGPQVYGDQHGNEKPGLPGNVYQKQLEAGADLFNLMSDSQRAQSLIAAEPIQTQIELQGRGGTFSGVGVKTLDGSAKTQVQVLIDTILEQYPEDDVAYANRCLDANGGVGELFLSYHEGSAYEGSGLYQTFRLEGPAAVFYFRGFPHVHAFINVGMDGESPLSVGESLGENPGLLQGSGLKAFFEKAMASETSADLAYYNLDGAVGLLRPGAIRTGDIYNAESWESDVRLVQVKGSEISGEFHQELSNRNVELDNERLYKVATINHVVNDRPELAFNTMEGDQDAGLLRDMIIAHLKKDGFAPMG